MSRFAADAVLLLVAVIWGGTFPVTKVLVEGLPANYLLLLRFGLAFILLTPYVLRRSALDRIVVLRGIYLGGVLWGAYALQTWGLQYTTASKAGFITGLSVVMVPVMVAAFLRRRPDRSAAAGAGLAAVGMGLLSLDAAALTSIQIGDLLVLGCAFLYALQIILIDRYTREVDSLQLAWIEVGTVGLLAGIFTAGFETAPPLTGGSWLGIVYLGLLATAFAQPAQVVVQRYTTPTRVAVILSLEPVFGALFAGIFLAEALSGQQVTGGALVMAGILVSELKPWRKCNVSVNGV